MLRPNISPLAAELCPPDLILTGASASRNQRFESIPLQRGVSELPVPQQQQWCKPFLCVFVATFSCHCRAATLNLFTVAGVARPFRSASAFGGPHDRDRAAAAQTPRAAADVAPERSPGRW